MSTRFDEFGDKRGGQGPTSMLEVYMHALDSPVGDDFLDQSNLGLGNYGTKEYWQQIQSFRNGLYADAGMARRIIDRAIYETKRKMAGDAFDRPKQISFKHPNPDSYIKALIEQHDIELEEKMDEDETIAVLRSQSWVRQSYIEEFQDEIWQDLGDEEISMVSKQTEMVTRYTGLTTNWVPPHWRMLKMRHEASRSKGARLIDNLFERVREVKDTTMETVGLE